MKFIPFILNVIILFIVGKSSEIEVVWLLDSSASVGRPYFINIKDLVRRTTYILGDEIQTVGFVNFGHTIVSCSGMCVDEMHSLNSAKTKTSAAIRIANEKLYNNRTNNTRIFVMVSDGIMSYGYGPFWVERHLNMTYDLYRFIYVEVMESHATKRKSDPFAFDFLSSDLYDYDTDHISIDFGSSVDDDSVFRLSEMILNQIPTVPPISYPSFSPTESPTFSSSFSPTEAPTFYPSFSPTESPTGVHIVQNTNSSDSECQLSQKNKLLLGITFTISILLVLLIGVIIGYRCKNQSRMNSSDDP